MIIRELVTDYALVLLVIGIWGIVLNRRNVIILFMSIELILLGVNMTLIESGVELDDIMGEIFALNILTVAAAEAAIGLALLVVYYRTVGTISINYINLLRK